MGFDFSYERLAFFKSYRKRVDVPPALQTAIDEDIGRGKLLCLGRESFGSCSFASGRLPTISGAGELVPSAS